MTNFTIDFFIDFYSNIPDEKWTVNERSYNGKHCALGLLYSDLSPLQGKDKIDAEDFLLDLPPVGSSNELPIQDMPIVRANNGVHDYYDGYPKYNSLPTPKERVLAYLKDVKNTQNE